MMECFNSTAPDDEELLRLALDEEPLRVDAKGHLEQCTICQQRLARYSHTNSYLLWRLYRSQCPSATRLNLYCAKLLHNDEYAGIAEHIAICPLCTNEVVSIRRLLASFEPFPRIKDASSIRSSIKRLFAIPVPWQPQLITRGVTLDARWPRQYYVDNMNISLHLARESSGELMLLGLFTRDELDEKMGGLEGIIVDLYRIPDQLVLKTEGVQHNSDAKELLQSARIDDLGNIVFRVVSNGEYIIIAHLPNSELVIEGLLIAHDG